VRPALDTGRDRECIARGWIGGVGERRPSAERAPPRSERPPLSHGALGSPLPNSALTATGNGHAHLVEEGKCADVVDS
jgi:hypothetical protein